jgi:hypothetical protein
MIYSIFWTLCFGTLEPHLFLDLAFFFPFFEIVFITMCDMQANFLVLDHYEYTNVMLCSRVTFFIRAAYVLCIDQYTLDTPVP